LTQRLRQGADLLGIALLDHVILGDDRCYSFADHGWSGA
jgi:DNA repair protein RadC